MPPATTMPTQLPSLSGAGSKGLYAVADETVRGVHATLTPDPVRTVRQAGREIAEANDAATAAGDRPAPLAKAQVTSIKVRIARP